MSEALPYRHTFGEWQKHPDYDFKPMAVVDDCGRAWVSCTVHISTAEKKIIGSVCLHHGSNAGYPHVDNLIEMKANLALITAAPNLLEACVALQMEAAARGCGLKIADEAIAKATTY